LSSLADRRKDMEIVDGDMANDARAHELALLLSVGLTTLQRWRHQFAGDGDGVNRRMTATATWLTDSVRSTANGS